MYAVCKRTENGTSSKEQLEICQAVPDTCSLQGPSAGLAPYVCCPCAAGSYASCTTESLEAFECEFTACEEGQYAAFDSASACVACPAGMLSVGSGIFSSTGAIECSACDAGKSTGGESGALQCID